MFLKNLIHRNRPFLTAAFALHRNFQIPANSYLLDLDTMEANARILAAEGQRLGLKVYAMTKQFGRNPPALQALKRGNIPACVAVDMTCATAVHRAGLQVGHLGHLVQIPRAEALAAAQLSPAYWTVFSHEKAQEANEALAKIDRRQNILARIHAPQDKFYTGHEGGFEAQDVLKVAEAINRQSHTRFAGITTFPALLFDPEKREVLPTPNLATLEKTASLLASAGFTDLEVNAPGTTSSVVMSTLASAGATQVEPGHGLTGTTPLHAVQELPENPAMLYLTEVSHIHDGHPYCFGGGLYIDPVFPPYDVKALVGADADASLANPVSVDIPVPGAIDYYAIMNPETNNKIRTGDTVVFGFRAQAFFRRAFIVPVSGISKNAPVVEGVWTADGRKTDWPL